MIIITDLSIDSTEVYRSKYLAITQYPEKYYSIAAASTFVAGI